MKPEDVERCYWINLDRSTERRAAFLRRWQAVPGWPFPEPIRFTAIEEDCPTWWQTGRGAWSILRSHLEIYAKCRREGVRSVLVLEDDAVFRDDFPARAREFMAAVPADWEMLQLGGNHSGTPDEPWQPPEVVNDLVLRPKCCTASHAYMLRNDGLMLLDNMLCRGGLPALADDNAHIDTFWSTLQSLSLVKAYTPWRFLVGQAAGPSFRTEERLLEDCYFDLPEGWLALNRNGRPRQPLPKIDGWLLPEEGEALARLARGRRVLEVGTYCGLSAAVMAPVAEQIDTLDTHHGDNDTGPKDTLAAATANLAAFGNVRLVMGDMADTLPTLNVSDYGLIYYDAQHDYEATDRGIKLLEAGGITPRTIVAFHDFNWHGVERAVQEFAQRQGRTILKVGTLAVT